MGHGQWGQSVHGGCSTEGVACYMVLHKVPCVQCVGGLGNVQRGMCVCWRCGDMSTSGGVVVCGVCVCGGMQRQPRRAVALANRTYVSVEIGMA